MLRTFTKSTCIPTAILGNPCHVATAWRARRRVKIPESLLPYVPEERRTTTQLDDLDLSEIRPQYKHVKTLENAPEDVRKLFSLRFGPRDDLLEAKLQQYAETLQRHKNDYDSLEMRIAAFTIKIRAAQEVYAKCYTYHKKIRSKLPYMVGLRNSYLEQLRLSRYERYWLVMKTLDLAYYSPPTYEARITARARNITDMKERTFAEVKRVKDEAERRKDELSTLQAEIVEKINSGEIKLPER